MQIAVHFNKKCIELGMNIDMSGTFIKNYACCQTGEVWYEVAGELAQEGLRPVTPDQECLVEIMQAHETKAENTLKQQVKYLLLSCCSTF